MKLILLNTLLALSFFATSEATSEAQPWSYYVHPGYYHGYRPVVYPGYPYAGHYRPYAWYYVNVDQSHA